MQNSILLNIKGLFLLAYHTALSTISGLVIMSLTYELILRPQSASITQHERFMFSDINPTVVFLADSRGVHALNNGILSKDFYNYSHFGEYPHQQILRAYHVLRDKPSVKVLVMQMDPYVFMHNRRPLPVGQSRGFYESLIFNNFQEIHDVVHPTELELMHNVIAFVFPLTLPWERSDLWGAIRYNLTMIGLDNAPERERYFTICGDIYNGLATLKEMPDTELKTLSYIAAEGRYNANLFDASILDMYRAFLNYAASKRVKVIGIQFPELRNYNEAKKDLVDNKAINAAIELGIPILDYSLIFQDQKELFNDPEHLTTTGSILLSKIVAFDIANFLSIPSQPSRNCYSHKPQRAWPLLPLLKRLLE